MVRLLNKLNAPILIHKMQIAKTRKLLLHYYIRFMFAWLNVNVEQVYKVVV